MNEDHFLFELVDPATAMRCRKEGGRARHHHTHQGSLPSAPIPYARPHHDRLLTVRLCRTLARMSKVRARTDDMLIIRGVNVFRARSRTRSWRIEASSRTISSWLTGMGPSTRSSPNRDSLRLCSPT